MLTAAEMTAKLAKTEERRALRALVRVQVATELGCSPFDARARREASRRIGR